MKGVTMNKKSSIELLFDWIEANMDEDNFDILSAKETAIKIHKKEITSAYCDGGADMRLHTYMGMDVYYQKKYGSNNDIEQSN